VFSVTLFHPNTALYVFLCETFSFWVIRAYIVVHFQAGFSYGSSFYDLLCPLSKFVCSGDIFTTTRLCLEQARHFRQEHVRA
jgi:hypothetical protein